MSHRRFSDELKIKLLNGIEKVRKEGTPVHVACRMAGITDTTYYKWRGEFL